MNTSIENFRRYFTLKEVVSPTVIEKRKEKAWAVFDIRLLDVMVWVREGIGKPITINHGTSVQRGFRENICQIVKDKTAQGILYVSGHPLGKAFDFDVKGMKAEDVRKWIREHIDECPWPIRLEKKVSWVHIDVMNIGEKKLEEFDK